MTKSELMVENRQLKKKVADIEHLHADVIENWKDEMEENARLRDALGALGAIGGGYCFCAYDRNPENHNHEPECHAARAALDKT